MSTPASNPPSTLWTRTKAVAPWLLAAGVLVVVFRKVDGVALLAAVRSVPLAPFVLLVVATNAMMLLADSFATTVAFQRLCTPLAFAEVLAIRGATYLLSLLNYGVGQGAFVYYVTRTKKASAARAGGVVLFVMGSTLLALAVLAAFAVFGSSDAVLRWYQRVLVVTALALVPYAVLLSRRPPFLARRELFAPLFDGGVGGQGVAVLARVPHLCVLLLGNYLALRLFGVTVPPRAALAYLPIVFLVTAIPVTPQGLGTTQLAVQYFFQAYGPGGAGAKSAIASVTAYSLAFQVGGMVVQGVLGLYFLRRTTQMLGRVGEPAAMAAGASSEPA